MTSRGGARLLVAIVCAVVAAVVATAIVVIDPPSQRLRSLDSRRVSDLSEIERRIDAHFERHGALPEDLAALDREPGLGRIPEDPEGRGPYEYEPGTPPSYRLCATFALDARDRDGPVYGTLWAHGAGRFCFDLEAED